MFGDIGRTTMKHRSIRFGSISLCATLSNIVFEGILSPLLPSAQCTEACDPDSVVSIALPLPLQIILVCVSLSHVSDLGCKLAPKLA